MERKRAASIQLNFGSKVSALLQATNVSPEETHRNKQSHPESDAYRADRFSRKIESLALLRVARAFPKDIFAKSLEPASGVHSEFEVR